MLLGRLGTQVGIYTPKQGKDHYGSDSAEYDRERQEDKAEHLNASAKRRYSADAHCETH
jgi:hypothetical protein